jgi:hypothetical protein
MGGEKRAECNSGMTGWQWSWRERQKVTNYLK